MKPEVRIKGKEWVVQRDECSEAAVLGVASFDLNAAGCKVDVNFAEVKRVWFGEGTRWPR